MLLFKGKIFRLFAFAIIVTGTIASSAFATPTQSFDVSRSFFSSKGLLPTKPLNTALLGISAFVNDQRFGSISAQFREVNKTLKLKHVRVLFAWNDAVQSSATSQPNFSFYDNIAKAIPRGTSAVVVLTGIPSWMKNSSNWTDGDPRKTFVEKWVKVVVARYSRNRQIKSWQIWNEPNMLSNPDNVTLDIATSPENYVDMLSMAAAASRSVNSKKLIVSAATTAINQGYPETLDYNKGLVTAGIENIVDIFAIHMYGTHLETILFLGVGDFINDITKPIWVTESGEKGVNNQRKYAQQFWPYLFKQFPAIKRLYIYQFTEATPAKSTYGLRNLTKGFFVSDLYIYLRDKK